MTSPPHYPRVGWASVPAQLPGHDSYKRRLPHWRQADSTYFVTWRLSRRQTPLADEERALVADIIQFPAADPFLLFAFVVMDDHAHALVAPQNQKLECITHRWKSFSAHQLQRKFGRQGAIWQSECFDRIVRNERDFLEKREYIFNNPFKRWPALEAYEWMGP